MLWIFPLFAAATTLFWPKKTQASTKPGSAILSNTPFGPVAQKPSYGPPAPSPAYGPYISYSPKDVDTLARTMWGEARGEGNQGMQAVANVIMNRYYIARNSDAYARQWGDTIANICTKYRQFSVWLPSDPNYSRLLAVNSNDPIFREALRLADQACKGVLPDLTGGATFYHTKNSNPKWAQNADPVRVIGQHIFYTTDQVA